MKQISKTKLKDRTKRKSSPVILETLKALTQKPEWNAVAKLLSGSTRKQASLNLFEIDQVAKAGDTIVIVGKVLSKGELTKKVKIAALSISEKAKEKLKHSKSEIVSIAEEVSKNPKAEGIKILR